MSLLGMRFGSTTTYCEAELMAADSRSGRKSSRAAPLSVLVSLAAAARAAPANHAPEPENRRAGKQ